MTALVYALLLLPAIATPALGSGLMVSQVLNPNDGEYIANVRDDSDDCGPGPEILGSLDPTSMAVSGDGKYLFIANGARSSDILVRLKRRVRDGRLTCARVVPKAHLPSASVRGEARSVIVSPDSKHIYLAGSGRGAILGLWQDSQTLGLINYLDYLSSAGPSSGSGVRDIHAMRMTSDGADIVAISQKSRAVAVFDRNVTGGQISLDSVYLLPREFGRPTGISVPSDGKHVYVAGNRKKLLTFSRNVLTGQLSHSGTLELPAYSSAIATSPDGRHVYITSDRSHSVDAYSRDLASGNLTMIETERNGMDDASDCEEKVEGMATPVDVSASPDGTRVYVLAGRSSAIVAFERNVASGRLAYLGHEGGSDVSGVENCYTGAKIGRVSAFVVGKNPSTVSECTSSPGSNDVYVASAGSRFGEFDKGRISLLTGVTAGPVIDPENEAVPQADIERNSYNVGQQQVFPVRCGSRPYLNPTIRKHDSSAVSEPVHWDQASSTLSFLPSTKGFRKAEVTDSCGRTAHYNFPVGPFSTTDPAPLPSTTYDEIHTLVEYLDIIGVAELLPFLPVEHRQRFALMRESGSLQGATATYPRAIMYGSDARLLTTFNGEPSLDGFSSIEFIQFLDNEARFEFDEITFPLGRAKGCRHTLEEGLPEVGKCGLCHVPDRPADAPDFGTSELDMKPIWDNYSRWRGAMGEDDDFDHTGEREIFSEEVAPRSPRYRFLTAYGLGALNLGDVSPFGGFPNGHLSLYLSVHNSERIVRRLAARPDFDSIRTAILGLLWCTEEGPYKYFPSTRCGEYPAPCTPFDKNQIAFHPSNHVFLEEFLAGLDVDLDLWRLDRKDTDEYGASTAKESTEQPGRYQNSQFNFGQTRGNIFVNILTSALLDADPNPTLTQYFEYSSNSTTAILRSPWSAFESRLPLPSSNYPAHEVPAGGSAFCSRCVHPSDPVCDGGGCVPCPENLNLKTHPEIQHSMCVFAPQPIDNSMLCAGLADEPGVGCSSPTPCPPTPTPTSTPTPNP